MEVIMSENLSIKCQFKETPEQLFKDFTEPNQLNRWFMEMNYWGVDSHTDLKVGGKYDVTMTTDIGNTFTHDGEFEEIEENKKLRFSWGSGLVEDTDVTITFNKIDNDHTEVIVFHENFPTVELRDRHIELWSNCLEKLEYLTSHPLPYPIYEDPDYNE